MPEKKKFTTVSIPTSLFKKLEDKIKGTSFPSVSSYVTYVLREVIIETGRAPQKEPFSREDEERIRARLRALGYLG